MSKEVKLLDCTLRDGGYVNDWNFGHDVILDIYKRLDIAGIDYIEVGFLDDRRHFDINKTIVPSTECYNEIFKEVEKKYALPVAMIDFGTCDISNIGDCNSTFIDGIRVIFKKEKIEQALPYCKMIKEKGYKLFIQAISITSYSDMELLEYVQKINEIKPYAFSIVDTYGLLDNRKLTNYFNLINNNLDPDIKIGYHAHNNFQLAFSNSIKFLALETNRMLIVDSTVYGMGKSAGNCASELIAMHMNEKYARNYDINQILEILDTDLMAIYEKQYWGYKYNFYISAMQNCHPDYVQYLLDKKTLSISSINKILSLIPEKIKLLYDPEYIEKAYTEYQIRDIDDSAELDILKREFRDRQVVILGPGNTILRKKQEIKKTILDAHALVIAVNFYPDDYLCDYIFISNAKRFNRLSDIKNDNDRFKMILTSNIMPYGGKPDFVLNYQSLVSANGENSDNALLLCLAAMCKCGVSKVYLAGFDGFSKLEEDYFDKSYSFGGNEEYRIQSNKKTMKGLKNLSEHIKAEFVTDSIYEGEIK